MSRRQPKFVTALLGLVWVAVVVGAVVMVWTRPDEYGWWVYAVPVMATAMLVLFVIAFLPKRAKERPLAKRLGNFFTGVLILTVLAILAVAVVQGSDSGSFTGLVVLIFVFVVFVRIFIDYVRHQRKKRKKEKATGE